MSVIANNIVAGAAGQGGSAFQIDRSVRLNSADSAYFSRTPSSAGNRKTWTLSFWVKFCGSSGHLISAGNDAFQIEMRSDGQYLIQNSGCFTNTFSTAVFRDYSAWQHFVIEHDATNTYCKIYVNGSLQKTITASNADGAFNNNTAHNFNGRSTSLDSFTDFYLAQVHFIDGQALSATDFGEFDSNGVWQPKAYSGGTYGTNGFHLDFSDNSSNAALGNDSSGNNNHWTVNNIAASAPGLSTANEGFDVVTYTGNGTGQSITDLNFQPDFVWLKARSVSYSHQLYDAIRGTTNALVSNATTQEAVYSGGLTAFNANGFTIGNDGGINNNTSTFVGWAWKAGGTPTTDNVAGAGNVPTAGSVKIDGTNMTTNLAGSLAATRLTANTTYGFSVVTWTVGTAPYTVAHGLGAEPYFIITKSSSANNTNWSTYHKSTGNQSRSYLNLNHAASSGESVWNNTTPTSDVFSLGSSGEFTGDMVAYCWSEVSGFSKFSDYNGNGSTQTITTGFKPAWIMIKRYDSNAAGADWYILDTKRISGTQEYLLSPNSNNNETATLTDYVVLNPDGFLLNTGTTLNGSSRSYIYAAFAEKPDESVIDSLIDTPTNYEASSGNNGGNYATLNPLNTLGSSPSLANGNLQITSTASYDTLSTIGVSSGKWYSELTATTKSGLCIAGIIDIQNTRTSQYSLSGQKYVTYRSTGTVEGNQSGGSGFTWAQGDTLGFALDLDSGTQTLKVYKNGSLQSTSNITASDVTWAMNYFYSEGTSDYTVNFGQRPFAFPVSGYKALCTANLPDPTIADGSTAMDAKLYTGNGTGQSITGLGFSPDLVWIKSRSAAYSHNLFDIIRGADKALFSDTTDAETTYNGRLTSFDTTGFTLGNVSTAGVGTNENSTTYVGWAWDGGTSNATNTDGSITSTVRANPSAGFSIVTFSGAGTAATIGHGLNAEPYLLLTKCKQSGFNWAVYHKDTGNTGRLMLNNNLAFDTGSGVNMWNNTTPTNSVFSVGSFFASSKDFVAYCFAPVEGYSAFGSYVGNGSSDGPFVYTGMRSRWIMFKASSTTGSWVIHDTEKATYNASDSVIYADVSNAEFNHPAMGIDIVSNGFKIKTGSSSFTNSSGVTYIWAAFAEHPFAHARAR